MGWIAVARTADAPHCAHWGCTTPPEPGRRRCKAHLEEVREYQRRRYDANPEAHKARCRAAYHAKNDGKPKKHLKYCRRCGEPGHFAKTCPQAAAVQP